MNTKVAVGSVFLVLFGISNNLLPAEGVANININATRVGEPTWRNYGTTFTDAQGRKQTLNMEVPFFTTVSINTSILVALGQGDLVIGKMQTKGVNGNTDLIVACTAGDMGAVKNLLARKALVNLRNVSGSTALMGSAASGHVDIVKLLIDKGARVNDKNNHGHTALMLAAQKGNQAVVDVLLANNANVNILDSGNNTALMYAISSGKSDVVKALLQKGARSDYTDKTGMSPMSFASLKKNREIVLLLGQAINP